MSSVARNIHLWKKDREKKDGMKKKIDIIGAGIAGLSTGCYLQMNGYDTEIFELHKQPGGLCTSWKRKDFTIDGCLHWLVGSSPGDAFHGLWNELVDMKSLTFVEYEEFIRVEDDQGRFIRVLTDIEQFEAELLIKAPEDKKAILEFTGAVKKFTRFNLPLAKAPEVMTAPEFACLAVMTP